VRVSCWIWLAAIVCLYTGCRHTSLPELPKINLTQYQPGVREVIGGALRDAQTNPMDAEAVGRFGMTLHAHDQFSAAAACYRRAAILDSKRYEYFYYWGAALSADGNYAEAIQPLTRAVALDGAAIPARLKLADAWLETGRSDEARSAYHDLIRQNSTIAAAHYGLARTMHGDEAIGELQKALELFPRYGAAQFSLAAAYRKAGRPGDAERAIAGYERNRTATPPLDDPALSAVFALNAGATGLLRQAQALERQGQLAEAVAVCERTVERYPKFAQAWIDLISLYGRVGQPEKLESAYRQAISIAPDSADAYYNYGVFCFQSARFEDARKAFEKTTELDPRNADAWNNLGSVVERTGALERAAEFYRRAISNRPEFRLGHFHLARVYANQGRYSDAIREFEQSLGSDDDQTPTYLYALAATHARAGHRQQSLQLLRKARDQAAGRGQTALVASIDRDMQRLGAVR
jgi:tetratricopeptide (TPR) repeat protein